jgi:hypothetical protein
MERDPHLLEPGKTPVAPRATTPAVPSPEAGPAAPSLYEQALTLPFSDQVALLQGALSFNRSQVAEVMQVSRPTLYAWIAGAEPGTQKTRRMLTLLGLVSRAGLCADRPLLPRFVRHPLSEHGTSLLELLRQDAPPEGPCLRTLVQAREMTARWAGRARRPLSETPPPPPARNPPLAPRRDPPEFNHVLL